MKNRGWILLGVLMNSAAVAAEPAAVPLFTGTGTYTRPIGTRSAEAQRYFDQGLALVWAFTYEDARRSFQAAARLDPQNPMAWWGVALASGPNINVPSVSVDHARVAWEALERAEALLDQARPVDRALIEAQRLRFSERVDADRASLDAAYADAMREAWRAFPHDPDVGVLFAEAMMDLRPWDQWTPKREAQPGTLEIVATLEQVLRISPNHPQGLHLYIHAVEGSPDPVQAREAADRLRNSMPGVGHMVHMPSHIDVLDGQWDEAVEANLKAVEVDLAFAAQGGTPRGSVWLYNAHHRHMLAFAAMMSGRSELALETMREMTAGWPAVFPPEWAAKMDLFYAMPFEVMVRFGRWDEILERPLPDASLPLSRALAFSARGIAHAVRGEIAQARAEQEAFREAAARAPAGAMFFNSSASAILGVAEAMLDGEIEFFAGQTQAGIVRLREAAEREAQLPYDEPPDWILPTRHALGAALLQTGRAAEAEAVYRADLDRWPGNGWSLYGLWRSLDLQHRDAEAESAERQFRRAWRHADLELHSSCLCQPGV